MNATRSVLLLLSLAPASCDAGRAVGASSSASTSASLGAPPPAPSPGSSLASSPAPSLAPSPASPGTAPRPSALPAEPCEDLASAAGGIPKADGARARGFDVATLPPLRAMKEAGHRFAFVQAAYGSGANAAFAKTWAGLRACGVPRGAYHFVTPASDGAVQARKYLALLGDDRGELPTVVDMEKSVECDDDCCKKPCGEWQALLDGWLGVVEKATGKKAMIYTIESFWNQCLCGTRRFAQGRPLWLAGYPHFKAERPVRFGGWARWDFFQDAGNVRAGATRVDTNLFAGDGAALAAWVLEHAGAPPDSAGAR